jgi:hypothetical protein
MQIVDVSGVLPDERRLACAIKPKECLRKTLDILVPDPEGNLSQVHLPEFFSDLSADLGEANVCSIARLRWIIELGCLNSEVVNTVSNL